MAVLAMVFSLGAVSTAQAAVVRSTLSLSPSTAIRGETVKATGRVPGAVARPVWVQRKSGSHWVTLAKAKTTRTGTYAISFKAPAIGSYWVRTLAPRVSIAGKVRAQLTAAARALKVVAQSATLSMPATVVAGKSATARLTFRPVRAGRAVALQVWRPSGWVKVVLGRQSATGTASLSMKAANPPSYIYRAWTAARAGAPAFTSHNRTVKVTAFRDITAPRPVTALSATTVTSSLITLSWTNPSDADFAGVMIRRLVGTTAPTATTGTLVSGGVASATSYTDAGLAAGTKYAYAVFAQDRAGNKAAPATFLSATSPADVTAPGPVTHLEATHVSDDSISLGWTNPTDVDFTGVTIRRAKGEKAPLTATAGTLVTGGDLTASSYIDNGLSVGQQYSYAVFAHDRAGNNAAADTVTATTTITSRPTAVLSVNLSHGLTAMTSVGGYTPSFDVRGSRAGSGASLVSAVLDYGDGTTESFTGDSTTWLSNHDYTTVGDKAVTVEITDSAGATAVDTVTVTVYPMPTAAIKVVGPVLPGQPVTFELTSATAEGTVFTDYSVCFDGPTGVFCDPTNGAPLSPTTITHTFDAVGTYVAEFNVYNNADGSALASAQVRVDVTAPAPVTDLSATSKAGTVVLAWTNPADADFAGVMIRRLAGATAPTQESGTVVSDTAAAATSLTDTEVIVGTQYSYAAFAHDGSGNFAAAANVTQTLVAPPTAVLSVNASTDATAKTSVGTIYSPLFDVSGSQAGAGTLVSASLDYGDGTTESFTGDPATWFANHDYATAGTMAATVVVTNSEGDTATATVTVIVFEMPTVTITPPLSALAGDLVTFGLTSSTPAGSGFTDYDVSYDNGATWVSPSEVPPTTLTHTFAAAGTYTVLFVAHNDADGSATASAQVTVTAP